MTDYERETLALSLTLLVHNVKGFRKLDGGDYVIDPCSDHVIPSGLPYEQIDLDGMTFTEMLESAIGTLAESLDLLPVYTGDNLSAKADSLIMCYQPKEVIAELIASQSSQYH
tara:strand:+ start:254 stop:592 length:339 start_codon:yes stop_codon:yes gene_type:complete